MLTEMVLHSPTQIFPQFPVLFCSNIHTVELVNNASMQQKHAHTFYYLVRQIQVDEHYSSERSSLRGTPVDTQQLLHSAQLQPFKSEININKIISQCFLMKTLQLGNKYMTQMSDIHGTLFGRRKALSMELHLVDIKPDVILGGHR